MPGSLVPRDLPSLAALIRHGIRRGGGRGAGGQDLGLGEHVLLLEPLRQGVDHRQCIVGAVVLIAHEPAAAPERADQFGVGDVLQFPGIVPAVALQAPDLAALDDVQRDIAHQLVHVAESLGTAVQAYVVVAAAQQRGQKRRVDVVPERPAVQLDAQFVHAGNGHGQGIVLVIVGLVDLAGGHDLRQAAQLLIGHSQRHIGEDEHPLGDELAPARRRGYHTFVSCKHCGEVVTCPSCSISLTYHSANNRLMCHYCGYSVPFTKECPGCHEPEVRYTGSGTQKAEEELCTLFPKARILRLDADSTMRRHAYETKMKAFSNGEYDIIIGTQMVAKGLDFENVTLVGVLSADQVLYSDDFRSNERGFDLMTQVVGRSGRGTKRGRAIIQTYTPENPVIALASHQDYVHFYQQEILFRKAMLYPPFADIVVIGFVGEQESKVAKASQLFLEMLSHLASKEYSELPIRALRPTPAQVAKVSNKYRYKLMIKCKNNLTFRTMLSRLLVACGKEKAFAGVTVYADSNPDMI